MRSIASAQAQFRDEASRDLDGDGTPEFGTFGELTGDTVIEGHGAARETPLLPSRFSTRDQEDRVTRSGYRFRLVLGADADGREAGFVVYAFPLDQHSPRAFRADDTGAIHAIEAPADERDLARIDASAWLLLE